MNSGKYVFTQIMGLVSSTSFQTIVNRHCGDYKVKESSCWKQFLGTVYKKRKFHLIIMGLKVMSDPSK
jgi:predicted SpoU family rRNA methylase